MNNWDEYPQLVQHLPILSEALKHKDRLLIKMNATGILKIFALLLLINQFSNR